MRKFSNIKVKKINESDIFWGEYKDEYKDENKDEFVTLKNDDNHNPFIYKIDNLKNVEERSCNINSFISKLIEMKEMSQVYHWMVKGENGSHSSHLAFDEFYHSMIELVDNLVEVYQGQYDIIDGYEIIDTKSNGISPLEYFTESAEYIKENRKVCISEEDNHLHSIIDEILIKTYKTIYKLKFNK